MNKDNNRSKNKDNTSFHSIKAHRVIQTPIGTLLVEASPKGVTRIALQHERNRKEPVTFTPTRARTILDRAERWLQDYFSGEPTGTSHHVPIAPSGTPFQQAVWRALRRVPFGQTTSYGELARAIARPGASRAVGGACGKNPILLLVPCHRVLATGGRLGGFSAGLHRKRWLLRHEAGEAAP